MSLTINLFDTYYEEWHKKLCDIGVSSEKATAFLKEQLLVLGVGELAGALLDNIDHDSLFMEAVAKLPPSQRHRLRRSDFG